MLEQPWHLRRATTQHCRWFRSLVELNALTQNWVLELQADRPAHLLSRGLDPNVAENLWMLTSLPSDADAIAALPDEAIDAFLDDTSPEDMLLRLERTVWAVQSWTLTRLLDRASPQEKPSLRALLEQIAWKGGRRAAAARWKALPPESREDLRSLLLAMTDCPFAGTQAEPFLIRRALPREIQLELRRCPHQLPHPEMRAHALADELCKLHAHAMRGFLYELNNGVSLEHACGQRCSQRWFFV